MPKLALKIDIPQEISSEDYLKEKEMEEKILKSFKKERLQMRRLGMAVVESASKDADNPDALIGMYQGLAIWLESLPNAAKKKVLSIFTSNF